MAPAMKNTVLLPIVLLAVLASCSDPDEGATLLHWAARTGDVERFTVLLERTADPLLLEKADAAGRTPLFWAVQTGQTEMVALLIARGVEVDYRHDDGRTLLHIAADGDHREVVDLLLEAGLDPDTPWPRRSLSARMGTLLGW